MKEEPAEFKAEYRVGYIIGFQDEQNGIVAIPDDHSEHYQKGYARGRDDAKNNAERLKKKKVA